MPTAIEQLDELDAEVRESAAFRSALAATSRENAMTALAGGSPSRGRLIRGGAKDPQAETKQPSPKRAPASALPATDTAMPAAGAAPRAFGQPTARIHAEQVRGRLPSSGAPNPTISGGGPIGPPESLAGGSLAPAPATAPLTPRNANPTAGAAAATPATASANPQESATAPKRGPGDPPDLERFRIESRSQWAARVHPQLSRHKRLRRSVVRSLEDEYQAYTQTQKIALESAMRAWQYSVEGDPLRPQNIPQSLGGQIGYSILTDQPEGKRSALREAAGAYAVESRQPQQARETPRITGQLVRSFELAAEDYLPTAMPKGQQGRRYLALLEQFGSLVGQIHPEDSVMVANWLASPAVYISPEVRKAELRAKQLTLAEENRIQALIRQTAQAYE